MKRYISLLLVFIMLLSLASCGTVKGETYTNDYADSKGNIVSRLEFHYPDTKGLSKEERNTLNAFFDTQKDEAENLMELNTDSVAYTLGVLGSAGPQVTLINNETVWEKDGIFSCMIYTRKAINDVENAVPDVAAETVNLSTGEKISITALAVSDKQNAASIISSKLTEIAKANFYGDGSELGEQKLELFTELFDEDNFYYDGENLVFPYLVSLVTGEESDEIYLCTLPLDLVSGVIMSPADYIAAQSETTTEQ